MKTALVFAGQGAQFAGMGKSIVQAHPDCGKFFQQADDVLGFSLSKLCFEGPSDELQRSDNCQPAIFVMSVACMCALRARTGEISYSGAAGLSLGEWTALHVCGSLGFEETLKILRARGKFMQEACEATEGGMVSVIGLAPEKVDEIRARAGVETANLNSPGQTVLSGGSGPVAEAEQLALEAGAKKAVVLKVAGAYHSSLMQSAREKLSEVLDEVEFKKPAVPVLSNVTGRPHGEPGEIRSRMLEQVTSTVHWHDSIDWLRQHGVERFIELGPGRVLSGLIRRIDRKAQVTNVQDVQTLDATCEALGV